MQSLLVVLAQDIPVDFKVEAAKELVDNAEALLLLSENQEQARLAIEDFQAFIAWGAEKNVRSQEVLERRQDWIDELETGSNPFDEALLGALRSGQ